MSAQDKKFESKDDLEVWLKGRGVDEKHSASAADVLSQKGITLSSELIGMRTQDLRDLGLDIIPANHLSNKLEKQQQPNGKLRCCFYILVFKCWLELIVNTGTGRKCFIILILYSTILILCSERYSRHSYGSV